MYVKFGWTRIEPGGERKVRRYARGGLECYSPVVVPIDVRSGNESFAELEACLEMVGLLAEGARADVGGERSWG